MPEHRVEWTDVKGAQDVKDALKECILLPLKFPALFKGMRVPHRGILLLGAPGTGKTLLARALQTEAGRDVTCFYVHAWDLLGKYSGDPEEKLRALFSAAQSREPAIIFLDDIEVIGSDSENDQNRSACNEMLIGFSQLQNNVFVVGLTHAPWAINLALLKRFSKRLYMPLPDTDARTDILGAQLRSMDHTLTQEHLRSLSSRCAGFSGSDLVVLVRDVAMEPVRRLQAATHFKKVNKSQLEETTCSEDDMYMYIPCAPDDPVAMEMTWTEIPEHSLGPLPVNMEDVLKCLEKTKPTISQDELRKFDEFDENKY
ncbi:vacuolar protein sorting-associated protein 4-like isoform X3 [Mya arenaria]|nr:vacuolar protein sorting-associated protein 4-like isoform X3 [Mya arenaria]